MIKISNDTMKKIKKIFPKEQQHIAENILEKDCSEDLVRHSREDLERVRQAILKISTGDIEKLKKIVNWAKIDWRDILMTAGFGDDPEAHKKWKP